jgi:hypothetical protein
MTLRLKVLSLALTAALATNVFAAGTAQAKEFTGSEKGAHVHTIIDGEKGGSHVFKAGGGFGGFTCAETNSTEHRRPEQRQA